MLDNSSVATIEEFMEPTKPIRQVAAICVFCGSSPGADPAYMDAASTFGKFLAHQNITLVYGGGRVGLMGAIADAALAAGGNVIGVIPESLVAKEVAHQRLSDLRVVGSMHERKALMADLADAFVALPGGCGTFEEFLEVLTWAQLGLHQKPCALLNVAKYYDYLLALLDHAVQQRFIHPQHRNMILVAETPQQAHQKILEYHPPNVPKWIDRKET